MNRNKEEMVSSSLKNSFSYFTKATTLEKQGDPALSLCKHANDRQPGNWSMHLLVGESLLMEHF